VSHEMGHVLGLIDVEDAAEPNNLMDLTLAPGVRRLPSSADIAVITPSSQGNLSPQPMGQSGGLANHQPGGWTDSATATMRPLSTGLASPSGPPSPPSGAPGSGGVDQGLGDVLPTTPGVGLAASPVSQAILLASMRSSAEPTELMNGIALAAASAVLSLGPGLDSTSPAPVAYAGVMIAGPTPAPHAAGVSIGPFEFGPPAQSDDRPRPAPFSRRLWPRMSASDLDGRNDPAGDASARPPAPAPDERSIPSDPIVLKAPRLPLGPAVKNRPSEGDIRESFLTTLFDEDFLDQPHGWGRLSPAIGDVIALDVLATQTRGAASGPRQEGSIAIEPDGDDPSPDSNRASEVESTFDQLANWLKAFVLGTVLTRVWPHEPTSRKETDEESADRS
jgi:hypothetical protein